MAALEDCTKESYWIDTTVLLTWIGFTMALRWHRCK